VLLGRAGPPKLSHRPPCQEPDPTGRSRPCALAAGLPWTSNLGTHRERAKETLASKGQPQAMGDKRREIAAVRSCELRLGQDRRGCNQTVEPRTAPTPGLIEKPGGLNGRLFVERHNPQLNDGFHEQDFLRLHRPVQKLRPCERANRQRLSRREPLVNSLRLRRAAHCQADEVIRVEMNHWPVRSPAVSRSARAWQR